MYHRIRSLALALLFIAPMAAAEAGDQPVVIELYTSQGCSSCPPADELMGRLARMDGVLPLALHVDYWDYIGWKDVFAQPGFTARQKAYARAAEQRTIYTPQMIVGGVDHVVGNRPMQVMQLIYKHQARFNPVTLEVSRNSDQLRIRADAVADLGTDAVVQVVHFKPSEEVTIRRGENAGKTIDYHNIVTDWQVVGDWDGRSDLDMTVNVAGPAAVIVQRENHGSILAAARAD